MNLSPKVTFVLGTRPEAIKLAPLIKLFTASEKFNTRVVLTGQHKNMVQNIFKLFDIKADSDLEIMQERQSLVHITNKVLEGLIEEIKMNKTDLIVVQGDTSTAFAAALTSFYSKIPIAHVEAGLRTNDLKNPYPEEGNRRLISSIADLHFAPTETSFKNLKECGIKENVYITGNTVVDSLLFVSQKIKTYKRNTNEISNFILVTIHRRENWGKNLIEIANGLIKLVERNKNLNIILPLHPNPIVREPLVKILGNNKRIKLSEPFEYKEFVFSLKKCSLVLTDSGGIQEEAPSLGKPVLVLRNNTERTEGIKAGTAKLIGTSSTKIIKETEKILLDEKEYERMSQAKNPYGDGNASEKIFKVILDFLQKRKV